MPERLAVGLDLRTAHPVRRVDVIQENVVLHPDRENINSLVHLHMKGGLRLLQTLCYCLKESCKGNSHCYTSKKMGLDSTF